MGELEALVRKFSDDVDRKDLDALDQMSDDRTLVVRWHFADAIAALWLPGSYAAAILAVVDLP